MVRKAGAGRTSYYAGEKTDGWISLQYLNGAEGESQPVLVMFLDYTRRMDRFLDLIMQTTLCISFLFKCYLYFDNSM